MILIDSHTHWTANGCTVQGTTQKDGTVTMKNLPATKQLKSVFPKPKLTHPPTHTPKDMPTPTRTWAQTHPSPHPVTSVQTSLTYPQAHHTHYHHHHPAVAPAYTKWPYKPTVYQLQIRGTAKITAYTIIVHVGPYIATEKKKGNGKNPFLSNYHDHNGNTPGKIICYSIYIQLLWPLDNKTIFFAVFHR